MKLNLKRPLVFFDLETTGVDTAKDRIVEISMVKVMPNGDEIVRTRLINPQMHIPEDATAVHGITDEDVKDQPTFAQIAKSLSQFIEGCDFGGFNSNRFDLPMLVEEFLRAGVDVDFKNRKFIDVQNIFHKMEQRTLVAAYKFYCDKDLTDAHSAEADTKATYEVLKAQLDRYPDLQKNLSSVINGFYANAATPEQRLFFTETLLYNFPGNITALDSAANELGKNNSGFEKLSPLEKSRLFAAAARLRYLSGDLDGAIKFQQRACDALPKNGDKTTAETFSTQLDFYLKLQIINKKEITL